MCVCVETDWRPQRALFLVLGALGRLAEGSPGASERMAYVALAVRWAGGQSGASGFLEGGQAAPLSCDSPPPWGPVLAAFSGGPSFPSGPGTVGRQAGKSLSS